MDAHMRWKETATPVVFLSAVIFGTATNLLIKHAAPEEASIALNGWRTFLAAAILLVPVLLFRIRVKLSPVELRWYVVLGAFTLAIPHALIFVATRDKDVTPTTLAFIEAAILGVVVVYLMASGRRVGVGAVVSTVLTFVGLVVFLGLGPEGLQFAIGDVLVVAAAVATAVGLIIAEKIEPRAEDRSFQGRSKRSTKKTFFANLLSGAGTLGAIAATNLILNSLNASGSPLVPVPAQDSWIAVLSLAVVGSCLTWFSMFLLIESGHLVLAAGAIAVVPITQHIASIVCQPLNQYLDVGNKITPEVKTLFQWGGGVIVLISIGVLIWLQLARNKN